MDWRADGAPSAGTVAARVRGCDRTVDCSVLLLEAGMNRDVIDGIGYAAATMTTISFLPQLIRVVKLKSARDISLGMFLIFSAGTLGWLIYGVLAHSAPVWMAN